jgi:hypothetical protein
VDMCRTTVTKIGGQLILPLKTSTWKRAPGRLRIKWSVKYFHLIKTCSNLQSHMAVKQFGITQKFP